jgi:hypothetical protein
MWEKYFTNVRWVELGLSMVVAVLTDLQLAVQLGETLTRERLLKSLGVGLGVGWAYLRVPKAPPSVDTPPTPIPEQSLQDAILEAVSIALAKATKPVGDSQI